MKKPFLHITSLAAGLIVLVTAATALRADTLSMSTYFPSADGKFQDLTVDGKLEIQGNTGFSPNMIIENVEVTEVIHPNELTMTGDLVVSGRSTFSGQVNAHDGVIISTTAAGTTALTVSGKSRIENLVIGTTSMDPGLIVGSGSATFLDGLTIAGNAVISGRYVTFAPFALYTFNGLSISTTAPGDALTVAGSAGFNKAATFNDDTSFSGETVYIGGKLAVTNANGTALRVIAPTTSSIAMTNQGNAILHGTLTVNGGMNIPGIGSNLQLDVSKGIQAAALGIGTTAPAAGIALSNGNLRILPGYRISGGGADQGFGLNDRGHAGLNTTPGTVWLDIRPDTSPDPSCQLQVGEPVALTSTAATRINGTMGITGNAAFSGKFKAYNGVLLGNVETASPACTRAIYGTLSYRCQETGHKAHCYLTVCTPCDNATGDCFHQGSGDIWLPVMTSKGDCAGGCGIGPNTTVPTID